MKLEASSGHADRYGLLEWAQGIAGEGDLQQVALVHCEMEPASEFRNDLQQSGIDNVIIPALGDWMPIG